MLSANSYFDHQPHQTFSRSSSLSRSSQQRPISNSDLLPYLLAFSVLRYRSLPQFKQSGAPLSPRTTRQSTSSLNRLKHRIDYNASRWNSVDNSSHRSDNLDSLSFSRKLPGEITTRLFSEFESMTAVGALNNKARLRHCYMAYYNELLKLDNEQNIKIEGIAMDVLVTVFVDSTEKQLQLLGGYPLELAGERDRYCDSFIDLLIKVVKGSTRLLALIQKSNRTLIKQLEIIKSSLDHNIDSGSMHDFEPINEDPTEPTFKIDDMKLAINIASILSVTRADAQNQIDSMRFTATEKLAIDELRLIQSRLHDFNEHHMYEPSDFNSDHSYQKWKRSENDSIEQIIQTFNGDLFNYNMFTMPPSPSPDPNGGDLVYIPNNTISYYKHFIKLCLEYDFKQSKEARLRNPGSRDFLLTAPSLELINDIAVMWRIPPVTKAMIFLDAAINIFRNEDSTILRLYDSFDLAKQFASESQWVWIHDSWPYCDRVYFVIVLQNLRDAIIDKVKAAIPHIYDKHTPKILVNLKPVLDDHILCYTNLEEEIITEGRISFAGPYPSVDQIKDLKAILIQTVLQKYDSLIQEVPSNNTINFKHISDLAEALLDIGEYLDSKYPMPLFDRINIAKISCKNHFGNFSKDCKLMYDLVMENMDPANIPSFSVVSALYRNIVSIRDLSSTYSCHFNFDIESNCYHLVEMWANDSRSIFKEWVQSAVYNDNFSSMKVWYETNPQRGRDEERNDYLHSHSAIQVFKIFESIDSFEGVRWRNEIQRAKILTTLTKSISDATCLYANALLSIFSDELKAEELQNPQYRSMQEEYMHMARTLIGGQEKSIPHHFVNETWVKLNNIEFCQQKLADIRDRVDPQTLFGFLDQAGVSYKPPSSFLFNITLKRAEGVKACDMNGLSDPYVSLIDPRSKVEIGRTSIMYKTLNPVWNKTFKVRTPGARSLLAYVWDDNLIQSAELCGKTSIQLDPNELEPFVPTEFSIDLDTQGKLIVGIFMECEGDDVVFNFKKALRVLKRTENSMIELIVGKFTPFIQCCISTNTMNNLIGHKPITNINILPVWFSRQWAAEKRPRQDYDELTIVNELGPLFDYFNVNFVALSDGLSASLRHKVLLRTWNVVLDAIEGLLKSNTKTIEIEIAITWLKGMRDFFHHDGSGPSLETLQSPKYWSLMNRLA